MARAWAFVPEGDVVPMRVIGSKIWRSVNAADMAPVSWAAAYSGTYMQDPTINGTSYICWDIKTMVDPFAISLSLRYIAFFNYWSEFIS